MRQIDEETLKKAKQIEVEALARLSPALRRQVAIRSNIRRGRIDGINVSLYPKGTEHRGKGDVERP